MAGGKCTAYVTVSGSRQPWVDRLKYLPGPPNSVVAGLCTTEHTLSLELGGIHPNNRALVRIKWGMW